LFSCFIQPLYGTGAGTGVGCVAAGGFGLLELLSVSQPLSTMSAAAARQVMMIVFIMTVAGFGLFDQKLN
jgi:hypothetical protein